IGFPIDNVKLHILDDQLRQMPVGTPGEIYIGGEGVARGYRNQAELTSDRFIPDPFEDGRQSLYRTGDLGRMLPTGAIAFLGRMDDQVKVRGYRIELDEISSVLKESPLIKACVVVAREDTPGTKRLIAYIVPNGSDRNELALRRTLRQRLPDYMEPTAFV